MPRKNLIKDSIRIFASSIVVMAAGMVKGVILPGLLGPAQFGIWTLMNVIGGNCANSHFGLLHGMNKEIPKLNAKGDSINKIVLMNSVFSVNLFLGLMTGTFLYLYGYFSAIDYYYPLCMVALFVVFQSIYVYYLSLLRAEHQSTLYSVNTALYAVLSTILVIVGSLYSSNKLVGALLGMLIAQAAIVIVLLINAGYVFRFRISGLHIKNAFNVGLPILIVGLVDMVLISMDKWLISWYLTDIDLGLYAFGLIFSSLISTLPVSFIQVIYPRIIENYSINKSYVSSGTLALRAIPLIAYGVIVCVVIANALVPFLISIFFPQYKEALPIVNILIQGGLFLSLTHAAAAYLIAVDRQNSLLYIQLSAIVVGFTVSLIGLNIGKGIYAVALGTVSSYAIYGLGYVYLAVKQITAQTRLAVVACVKILTVYSIVILAIRSEYFTIVNINRSGYAILLNVGLVFIVLGYAIISDKNCGRQAG